MADWSKNDGGTHHPRTDPAASLSVRLPTELVTCKNEVGPSLAGIVGSKSASVPGYDFSPAMKDANVTWDDANLDKYLANPTGFIHGTRMLINLPSDTDRQNVIAYLNTLKK